MLRCKIIKSISISNIEKQIEKIGNKNKIIDLKTELIPTTNELLVIILYTPYSLDTSVEALEYLAD